MSMARKKTTSKFIKLTSLYLYLLHHSCFIQKASITKILTNIGDLVRTAALLRLQICFTLPVDIIKIEQQDRHI